MHPQQQQQQPHHHHQQQAQTPGSGGPDSPTLVETRTIENFQFNEPFDVMQASSSASAPAPPPSSSSSAAAATTAVVGRSRESPPADSALDTGVATVARGDGSPADGVDLTTDNLPAVDTPDACDKAAMR